MSMLDKAEKDLKEERKYLAITNGRLELAKLILVSLNIDCGDNSCRFTLDRSGMRTNGGCRCLGHIVSSEKRREAQAFLLEIRNKT